jgi:putative intracellular protease/amidase
MPAGSNYISISMKFISAKSLLIILTIVAGQSVAQTKKILIVSTNTDSLAGNRTGTFLYEIAYPWKYFVDHGYKIDIVTPKGGKASIYQRPKETDDLLAIQADPGFLTATNSTLTPEQVKPSDYAAVFYPGGHGQYFDVVNDERIAKITAAIYEHGGVVGTAGHGAASLINVILSDCSYLVSKKSMTCFPWWAEKKFMNISSYGKLLPFDMQEVLARRGSNLSISTFETYRNADLNEIVDAKNRIVTGAFARSAKWVAEQIDFLINNKE